MRSAVEGCAATTVSDRVLAKEDFAFVVDASVAAGDLVALVRRAGGALVEDARVFDVYAGAQVGEGLKSVAVNVRMRAADHTLTAEEVLNVREAVIAVAEGELGATLRSSLGRCAALHDVAVGEAYWNYTLRAGRVADTGDACAFEFTLKGPLLATSQRPMADRSQSAWGIAMRSWWFPCCRPRLGRLLPG